MDLKNSINDLIDKRYEEIKSECSTYKELRDKIEEEIKHVQWKERNLFPLVSERLNRNLKRDIDNVTCTLPIR